ncbi:hypothetical protein SRO_0128 [Streptomyces rochei]|nr:hypothetical protein SRO_0128 [Streptomyces rochei]
MLDRGWGRERRSWCGSAERFRPAPAFPLRSCCPLKVRARHEIGRAAALSGLSLLWGSVFLWIKISGYGFSPVEMVFVRLVLGAAMLMATGLSRGQRPPRDRKLLGHMALAALLGNAVP